MEPSNGCDNSLLYIPLFLAGHRLQAPAEQFISSLPDMFELGENPIILWKPVVERDFGQERFLPDDPTDLLRRGEFPIIPIMTGLTEFEMFGAAIGNAM